MTTYRGQLCKTSRAVDKYKMPHSIMEQGADFRVKLSVTSTKVLFSNLEEIP